MSSSQFDSPEVKKLLSQNPEFISRFLDGRAQYEELCDEIIYIFEKRLRASEVEYASISGRAKTLKSFVEKVSRKKYKDPFSDITDKAGVRVVCLYRSDLIRVEEILRADFNVLEKIDKVKDQGEDKFGYGAVHYIITLGKSFSGARYEDLKDLVCEVQVRTVLQDAWAIIDHHLFYKKGVAGFLKRKLNSIAGIIELTDDQFDNIREDQEKYIEDIEKLALNDQDKLMSEEINKDTLKAYLERSFPSKSFKGFERHLQIILNDFNSAKYSKIGDIDDALKRTKKAREEFGRRYNGNPEGTELALGEVARAIGLDDETYRDNGWDDESQDLFGKLDHLVER